MNKKFIIFNLVIFLAVGSITAYSLLDNNIDFKTSIFDGIKINVPSGSEFVKIDNYYYKDNTRFLEINTVKNYSQVANTKFKLVNDKNLSKIQIKELKNNNLTYISNNGTIKIFICNKNKNEGILISTNNKTLGIAMAKTVIFNKNNSKNANPHNASLNTKNTYQNNFKNKNFNNTIQNNSKNVNTTTNSKNSTNNSNFSSIYPSEDIINSYPYNLVSIAEARYLAEKQLNNDNITIIGPFPVTGAWQFIMKDKQGKNMGVIAVSLTTKKVFISYDSDFVSDNDEFKWNELTIAEAKSIAEKHVKNSNLIVIGPYLGEVGFNFIIQDTTGKNIGFLIIDSNTKEISVAYS